MYFYIKITQSLLKARNAKEKEKTAVLCFSKIIASQSWHCAFDSLFS